MSLTDRELQALKPRDKPYKMADGHGLYVEVLPSGGRSWRLKYRFCGKEKRLALGLYPTVSLKEARDKAHEARKLLSDGIDPSAAKKEIKQAQAVEAQAANVITFDFVVKELLVTKENRQVTARHLHDVKRSLERHVLPTFGNRDIKSILEQNSASR